jgi:hypothetical protein
VKLKGQAEVARLMGSEDTSAAIEALAAALARETDVSRLLAAEARAGLIYWKLWKDVPVRFARRNPRRFGPTGRSLPGRTDLWLTFGRRATTPGNAVLNYLYALLECEMTVALLAAGLDPGIGMFHTDVDCRSSLALDVIEAARPHIDYWLHRYLASSAFANRDFTELPDGEVRLTHPLNSHLAYTAALWRKACEPIAQWLAQSFGRAASVVTTVRDRMISVPQPIPPKLLERARKLAPLTLPAPASIRPDRSYLPRLPQGRRRNRRTGPVPPMCWECGKALTGRGLRFCSPECSTAFTFSTDAHRSNDTVQPEAARGWRHAWMPTALSERKTTGGAACPGYVLLSPERRVFCSDVCADNDRQAMGKWRPVVEPAAPAASASGEERYEELLTGRRAVQLPASDRKVLRRWYAENLQPRLSRMHPTEIDCCRRGHAAQLFLLRRRRYAHSAPAALSKLGLPRRHRFAQVCRRTVPSRRSS